MLHTNLTQPSHFLLKFTLCCQILTPLLCRQQVPSEDNQLPNLRQQIHLIPSVFTSASLLPNSVFNASATTTFAPITTAPRIEIIVLASTKLIAPTPQSLRHSSPHPCIESKDLASFGGGLGSLDYGTEFIVA